MMSWWCLVLARWHCSHYKPQALHKKSLHPTIRSTSQAPAEALQALRTTSYRATRHFQQDAIHCSENLDFKTSHPAEIRRVEWVEWNTELSEWYFEYKSLLDNKRLNLDLMALWTCLMISCVVSHPKPETVCSNSPGSFHSLESSSVQSHRAMEIHSMCDINIPDIPEILHITMKLQTCHETAGASTLPKVCKRRIIKVIQSHPILSKHHGLGRWRLRFPCLWSFGLSTCFSKACLLPWVVVDAHEILQQSPKVQGLRHSKVRPEKLENLEPAWFFLIAPYCPQFGPQNVGTCHYHVTISNHVKVSCWRNQRCK